MRRELGRGAALAQRWTAEGRLPRPVPAARAVSAAYLERLRLGLGSPFRLIDYATTDPRLTPDERRDLGWALLARVVAGEDYAIEPAALDDAGIPGVPREGTGRFHLRLIENAVKEARDPRGGELAVRLAYGLAAAERSVGRDAPRLAAAAAALLRDRELARIDARRLLRTADRLHEDPLALLPRWRAERRFLVEAPPLEELPQDVEREAMEMAPRLQESLRLLAPRLAGQAIRSSTPPAGGTSDLGMMAALELASTPDSLELPPETPIVVATMVGRAEILGGADAESAARVARQRFVDRATDGERYVVEHARLRAADPRSEAMLARLDLAVATALRSYAQEATWWPSHGGPSARELHDRLGLSVSFDANVPALWRPYYRRMLSSALADLQRVLPALDFRGLRVRIGRAPAGQTALALHDPRNRTIYLPPATGAGTIAHEFAHDLDYQVAERRYGVTGDYATDFAMRTERGRLAASVTGLSSATLVAPTPGVQAVPDHAHRPAEVFARNMEWFVAVSLAREGRTDGYLSSVQDDMLTGYGTVAPPDISGGAGRALVAILDDVAPVHADTRAWFLKAYGPDRVLTPFDLLRRVLETPTVEGLPGDAALPGGSRGILLGPSAAAPLELPFIVDSAFAAVRRARSAGFSAIEAWICDAPGAVYDRGLEQARRRLVMLAAGARARGLALRIGREAAGNDGRRWVARALYGAPWPGAALDSTSVAALRPVIARARAMGRSDLPEPGAGFGLERAPEQCAARPFPALDGS